MKSGNVPSLYREQGAPSTLLSEHWDPLPPLFQINRKPENLKAELQLTLFK